MIKEAIIKLSKKEDLTYQEAETVRKLALENVVFVSESGIKTSGDIQKLYDNQVDAVLIGEILMRSQDKKAALEELNGKPLK